MECSIQTKIFVHAVFVIYTKCSCSCTITNRRARLGLMGYVFDLHYRFKFYRRNFIKCLLFTPIRRIKTAKRSTKTLSYFVEGTTIFNWWFNRMGSNIDLSKKWILQWATINNNNKTNLFDWNIAFCVVQLK